MKKALHARDVSPDDSSYSPGVMAEGRRIVVVSGQGGSDLRATPEAQVRQAFERIRAVLEAAGGTLSDIVMLRSYFVHFGRDLPVYRKVRRELFVAPYPASTAVGVTELAPAGNTIEIEAIAVLP